MKVLKNKYVRIGLVLFVLVLIVAGVLLLLYSARNALFNENQHFVLKKVEVNSTGWWKGRSPEVCQSLGLKKGEDNLFSLDLKTLRLTLEQEPSIEKVEVRRILPDTLLFTIREKIPRALLGSRTSKWVVDSSCMVMDRESCPDFVESLPVIIDLPRNVTPKPGNVIEILKPSIKLIMLTRREYAEFTIKVISLANKGTLDFILYYNDSPSRRYTVRMPDEKISFYLDLLRVSVKEAKIKRDSRTFINLLYDGNVIFKVAPKQDTKKSDQQ